MYTSGNLIISYWNDLFLGIRQCYLLKKNITSVPRIDQATIDSYVAQADFLIAYFHMLLIKCYGPVVLVKELPVLDTPKDNLLGRTSYDECVQWTCDMFDDAAGRLPATRTGSEYGLATSVAAKALKARLLLYAASPLFNGNTEYYSDFVNTDGSSLMPLSYDENKWKKAADAALEAINLAESNGYSLYEMREGDLSGYPEPQDLTQRTLRFTFMDKDNSKEVLFAETRKAGAYGLQPKSLPYLSDGSWNGVAPTLTMVERFYTKNGLPIDEDPKYYTPGDYFKIGQYEGRTTCNLNLKREPRFYSWVSFHNGYFEMQREGYNEGRIVTMFRKSDNHGKQNRSTDFSLSGYLVKKWCTPTYDTRNGFQNYPWPVIRLGELYLNLAEAAAEAGELNIAKTALNKIREHAGIPTVEKSWEGIATLTKDKLIEIIRQERIIELSFEGHYRWDMARWKELEHVLDHNPSALNTDGVSDEDFFRPVVLDRAWKFTSPTHYLLPIADSELNKNTLIVQNPGY